MAEFNHGAFVRELRKRRGKIPADLYEDLMAALGMGLRTGGTDFGNTPAPRRPGEPAWLSEARTHMGEKEIPGGKHSGFIMGMIKALGGWFTDDETPWCGTFAAYCLLRAGHTIESLPKHWYRARAWADWGKASPPRLGAIVVFGRAGGGHVGFLVGEGPAHWYVLGGNQSNAVNIAPIAKSRQLAIRWPAGLALADARLPAMAGGTISRNEA